MLFKDKRIPSIVKLARQVFSGYKLQIIILTLLGFLGGLLEGIGINAVIPLLSFLVEPGEVSVDFISRTIRRAFDYVGLDFSLKYLLIFICSMFVLKALVMILCNYIKVKIVSDYDAKMKKNLFQKVLAADWPHLLHQKVGYASTIVLSEATSASQLLGSLGQIIIMATGLLVYIVIAFNISSNITLLCLALGGILFLAFKPFFYRARVFAAERAKIRKKTIHHIDENIIGMKTIKAMSVEKSVGRIADNYLERLKILNIKTSLIKNFVDV